jgi:hypothetical protein
LRRDSCPYKAVLPIAEARNGFIRKTELVFDIAMTNIDSKTPLSCHICRVLAARSNMMLATPFNHLEVLERSPSLLEW